MKIKKALLFLLAVILLLPIVMTMLYSFFPKTEIKAFLDSRNNYDDSMFMAFEWSPSVFSLTQYYTILIQDTSVLRLLCNSLFYTIASLALQAIFIPMLAFALAKMQFFGRNFLSFLIVCLMILPFQVTMAPNVLTLKALGLLDTVWAVILPMAFAPFYIFLLRQFMVALPTEILEAAAVDGAGAVRTFFSIALPPCRPVLGAAAALSFADLWNMVEQPLLYLSSRQDLMPLSTMFNQLSESNAEIAFAGAALYILPAILVYLYFQKDIETGIQLSELK